MVTFALDELCTAEVISFTSPIDACRLSAVSSMFKSASESDTVWEKILPSDYRNIILQSSDPSLLTSCPSKKQLYFSLCHRPILIDNCRKSFSLDKATGKKCYMLSARDLRIIWGNAVGTYWDWTSEQNSRFEEVAVLIEVCWLHISGRINTRMLSPATLYAAYFVYSLTSKATGFDGQVMEAEMRIVGDEIGRHEVYLDTESGSGNQRPKPRNDGWMEIKLGEFYNPEKDYEDDVLEMIIKEVKRLQWKSGLVVEGIEIRPKED